MPREKINLNIDVSTVVVQGREVKLPFLKCEASVDVIRCEKLTDVIEKEEPVRGFIEVDVRDSEGRVVQRGRHEMRSFVNNLLRMLEGFMRAVGGVALEFWGVVASTTVIALDGSSQTTWIERYAPDSYYGGGTPMALKAGDNDDSYGIIVGSGTTTVTLDQYSLASKIPHGTGAGQLDYDPVTVEDLGLDTSVSPPVYRLRVIRAFKNLSGGDVSISEVGLVARAYWKDSGGLRQDIKYLIARDVLPTSYTVPNGGSATVAVTVEVVLG